jgi:tol-pal system protein YbgF
MQDMEIEMQRLREMIERLQASGGNEQVVRSLQERVANIERQLGIEAAIQNPTAQNIARGAQTAPPGGRLAPQPLDGNRQPPQGVSDSPDQVDIRSIPLAPDEKLYREAYAAYKSGNYDQAVAMLDDFLKRFPQSTFAADAVYWTGESRFSQGRYDEAVLLYDRVLKEFPGSKKELNALLKQGQAFEKMGDPRSAKIIFQKIVTDHPHTAQARLAHNKIKSLPSLPAE